MITREAVDRTGTRARLLRELLRVHLRLTLRQYGRNALKAARARPADLWVAHDLETLPVALRAREQMGGKVIYDSHELFTSSPLTRGDDARWQRVERRCIGRADAVMTVSDGIARCARRVVLDPQPEVLLNVP